MHNRNDVNKQKLIFYADYNIETRAGQIELFTARVLCRRSVEYLIEY